MVMTKLQSDDQVISISAFKEGAVEEESEIPVLSAPKPEKRNKGLSKSKSTKASDAEIVEPQDSPEEDILENISPDTDKNSETKSANAQLSLAFDEDDSEEDETSSE